MATADIAGPPAGGRVNGPGLTKTVALVSLIVLTGSYVVNRRTTSRQASKEDQH